MKKYPEDYNGPKARQSTQDEWTNVDWYDAWTYSDFDCFMGSWCDKMRKLEEKPCV